MHSAWTQWKQKTNGGLVLVSPLSSSTPIFYYFHIHRCDVCTFFITFGGYSEQTDGLLANAADK